MSRPSPFFRMSAPLARACAASVLGDFGDTIERAEIAGDLRRGASQVSDLSLVMIPKPAGLWGDGWRQDFLDKLTTSPRWTPLHKVTPASKMAVLRSTKNAHFSVKLWLCTPETWGWIFMLRTGPEDFVRDLTQQAREDGLKFDNGRLWRALTAFQLEPVPTPEESDIFRAMDIGEIDPADRSSDTLRKVIAMRGQLARR